MLELVIERQDMNVGIESNDVHLLLGFFWWFAASMELVTSFWPPVGDWLTRGLLVAYLQLLLAPKTLFGLLVRLVFAPNFYLAYSMVDGLLIIVWLTCRQLLPPM